MRKGGVWWDEAEEGFDAKGAKEAKFREVTLFSVCGAAEVLFDDGHR
jgi:hypothetical protein